LFQVCYRRDCFISL